MFARAGKTFTLALVLISCSTRASADPLKAGAQGTEVSDLAAKTNPASAAFVRHSRFTFFPRIYERNKVNIRYPGFETIRKERNGISQLQLISFIPTSSESSTSKFGWAITEVLPPISIPFAVENVPLVILEQQNIIDVAAKANLKWGLGGLVFFRASRTLAFGLLAAHRELGIDIDILESETAEAIAEIELGISQTEVRFGMLYRHPTQRVSFGLSSIVYQLVNTESTASSPLVEPSPDAPAEEEEPPSESEPQVFSQILFGIGLRFDRLSAVLDLEYHRANPEEKAFSVVDFTEKPRDVHDTLSVRTGFGLQLGPSAEALAGFAYVPANVGPGSPGIDGKSGFGLIDVIKVAAGLEDLRPYQVFVTGIRRSFGTQEKKRKVGKTIKSIQYPKWIWALGVGFQNASLGIDEEGEQPAAYQQTKLFVPAQISYQF